MVNPSFSRARFTIQEATKGEVEQITNSRVRPEHPRTSLRGSTADVFLRMRPSSGVVPRAETPLPIARVLRAPKREADGRLPFGGAHLDRAPDAGLSTASGHRALPRRSCCAASVGSEAHAQR